MKAALQRVIWTVTMLSAAFIAAPQACNAETFAGTETDTGSISGVVTANAGTIPVCGALIVVEDIHRSIQTDENGAYLIENMPPGICSLYFWSHGYLSERITGIVVGSGENTQVDTDLMFADIALHPSSIEADIPDGGICMMPFYILNTGTGLLDYDVEISPVIFTELKQWTTMQMPGGSGVLKPAACFGAEKLFIVGGTTMIDDSILYPGIQIFDTDSGIGFESTPMPIPVYAALAVYHEERVFVAGGFSETGTGLDTLQIYDIRTNTWTVGTPMPDGRGGNAGGIIDGRLYSLGGTGEFKFTEPEPRAAYAYDFSAETWTVLNTGPGIDPDHTASAAVLNDTVYVCTASPAADPDFYAFSPENQGTWQLLAPPPATLTNGSLQLVAMTPETKLLAFGGTDNGTPTGTTCTYDPAMDRWNNANRSMAYSVRDGAAAMGDGEIFYFGGADDDGNLNPPAFMRLPIDRKSWVFAEPSEGVVAPGENQQIRLYFHTELATGPGTYTAEAVIRSNDPDEDPAAVEITMNVTDPLPTPCTPMGTEFEISQDTPFHAGDIFWLKVHVCNASFEPLVDIPVMVILGIGDAFWFWPGWTQDVDYQTLTFPPDRSEFFVFESFEWPEVTGSGDNLALYCGMLTPEMDDLIGEYDYLTFGYEE